MTEIQSAAPDRLIQHGLSRSIRTNPVASQKGLRLKLRAATLALSALSLASLACGGSARPASVPAEAPGLAGTESGAQRPASIPPGTRLSIATGGTGGVYFPLGGGLAAMLQKHHNVQVTAEVTPASVDNLKLINDQPKEIVAFSLADTAFDALQGRERFSDTGPIQVRSLGVLYANFTHLVAAEGSGISTPADLRGKRVSVGAAGSGTETIANRVLDAYGINPSSDLQRERLGAAESAGALKDRRLDAFFWSGGLPTGAVTDLANTPGLSIRLIPHAEGVPQMNRRFGDFYTQATIPEGTYRGIVGDVVVSGLPNILAVHQDFPENIAYALLATIFDQREDWDGIHPEAKNMTLQTAPQNNPVPLHPGAIRFYRDRGVLGGS